MNPPRYRVRRMWRRFLAGSAFLGIPGIVLAATSLAEFGSIWWALKLASAGCILGVLLVWRSYAVSRRKT